MDFRDTPAQAASRDDVRTWLREHLVGERAGEIQRNIIGERVLGVPREPR